MWPKHLSHALSGRRSKFAVLAAWLIIAAIAGPLALKLTEVQDNEQLGALPASAEAKQALDRAGGGLPRADGPVAVAVYARDTGLTDADRAEGRGRPGGVRAGTPRAARSRRPQPSDDGQAMLLAFPLAGDDAAQSRGGRRHQESADHRPARRAADGADRLGRRHRRRLRRVRRHGQHAAARHRRSRSR